MPVPVAMITVGPAERDKLRAPRLSKFPCGFCSTESHHLCKRNYRSGDKSITLCPCTEGHYERTVQCTECYNRSEGEVDTHTYLCIDTDACEARITNRIRNNPTIQMIEDVRERATERAVVEGRKAPTKPRGPGRPKTGKCLCCGDTTGGGKFLPGHDARLLSRVVSQVLDGGKPVADVRAEFAALGVSEALLGKFDKRVAK